MNIAVVGAGKGGSNIINSFSNIDDLKISIVVDRNLDAPGISLAKKLEIPYSDSIDDINSNNIDIIIEATGNDNIANILKDKFGNDCSIVDSKTALILMTLVERDIETLEKINAQISVIDKTSQIVQDQLQEITDSIDDIHAISDNLSNATRISGEYINKSDEIIRSVNKIAQQTKILGLNASIEAARAGEQGRGFSVVANEVQKLAKYSEDFSKEINAILMKLSEEIGKINEEVNKLRGLSEIQVNASSKVNNAVDTLVETCKSNNDKRSTA